MPKHIRTHSYPPDPEKQLPKFSIFNNVTVNVPVHQEQEQKNEDESKQEDCCKSCFSALIQCLKPK